MDNKKKFLELVSGTSDVVQQMQWRRENREWLRKSQSIAVKILQALKDQNRSQKHLAEELHVSPQAVSKWVQGKENFTLETIAKLEKALGIKLLDIAGHQRKYDIAIVSTSQNTFSVGRPRIPTWERGAKQHKQFQVGAGEPWAQNELYKVA